MYTFAMVKSDALKRGSLSSIIRDLHKRNFAIRRETFRWLTAVDVEFLYADHIDKPYWEDLKDSVKRGAYLMVLGGPPSSSGTLAERWRMHMSGEGLVTMPGMRGLYKGPERAPNADNALHGADSPQRAKAEIAYFFPDFDMAHWRI